MSNESEIKELLPKFDEKTLEHVSEPRRKLISVLNQRLKKN